MSEPLPRRTFLRTAGGVSLAVLLAACTRDGTSGSTEVTTTDGSTADVDASDGPTTIDVEAFDAGSSCTLTPELTEGPYYFEVDAIRRDIREDRDGTPLRLGIRVRDADTCTPLENAVVDVWHCDAEGTYSGYESASQGANAASPVVTLASAQPSGPPPDDGPGDGGGGGGGATRSDDETYLRGAQTTDADGIAEFLTVFPGWYVSRTVHIHLKVHLDATTVLTTQLFFAEDDIATVYADAPYASRPDRDTSNEADSIYTPETVMDVGRDEDGAVLGLLTIDVAAA